MATRWGCVGLGRIASDFFTAIKENLPADEHKFVGAASRDVTRTKAFVEKFGFETAHTSYEELANNADIDVVYIATIHPEHANLCCMMLNAGKNVLCEKPLAMNSKEVKKVTDLAKEKKLFLMEGYWSRFFPVYRQLRKDLDDGLLGTVWHVNASMCKPIAHFERVARRDLGGGIFMTLGLYNIQLACFIFPEMPVKIVAEGILNSEGMDEGGSILLKYKSGATCSFSFHGKTVYGFNTATILGSKGKAELDKDFIGPNSATTPSGRYEFPIKPGQYNFPNAGGLHYEAAAVRQCLLNGETESPLCPLSESKLIMEIMDEVRRQLGVTYPADED